MSIPGADPFPKEIEDAIERGFNRRWLKWLVFGLSGAFVVGTLWGELSRPAREMPPVVPWSQR